MLSTAYVIGLIAVGSVLVGIGVQRLAAWYLGRFDVDQDAGSSYETMTYTEAMARLGKLAPAQDEEGSRRRRPKRKLKPELVTLSMFRYGEHSTDDSKLTIQAWRPDPSHRLAGHFVIDIIPKVTPDKVQRRLAIDLETVEAARVVALADGEAFVMAVCDYEVKGQGLTFKDLDYAQGVGVDDTTLYIVLVIRDVPGIAPSIAQQRRNDFRRLARGVAGHKVEILPDPSAARPDQPSPQPETTPLVGSESSHDPAFLRRLPNTTVDHFFYHAFRSVF